MKNHKMIMYFIKNSPVSLRSAIFEYLHCFWRVFLVQNHQKQYPKSGNKMVFHPKYVFFRHGEKMGPGPSADEAYLETVYAKTRHPY